MTQGDAQNFTLTPLYQYDLVWNMNQGGCPDVNMVSKRGFMEKQKAMAHRSDFWSNYGGSDYGYFTSTGSGSDYGFTNTGSGFAYGKWNYGSGSD